MAVFLLWAFILVLSPGRNGVYDGIGTSDLKKGLLNAYGGYECLANYKTQKELVVILRDATIETSEAVVGTYVVEAEDGVSYYRVDVIIVETLPTVMRTLPKMSLGIGIADRSYPLLNYSQIETPTQSPTSTPPLGIEKICAFFKNFELGNVNTQYNGYYRLYLLIFRNTLCSLRSSCIRFRNSCVNLDI